MRTAGYRLERRKNVGVNADRGLIDGPGVKWLSHSHQRPFS
jgi:hypothetical protein